MEETRTVFILVALHRPAGHEFDTMMTPRGYHDKTGLITRNDTLLSELDSNLFVEKCHTLHSCV